MTDETFGFKLPPHIPSSDMNDNLNHPHNLSLLLFRAPVSGETDYTCHKFNSEALMRAIGLTGPLGTAQVELMHAGLYAALAANQYARFYAAYKEWLDSLAGNRPNYDPTQDERVEEANKDFIRVFATGAGAVSSHIQESGFAGFSLSISREPMRITIDLTSPDKTAEFLASLAKDETRKLIQGITILPNPEGNPFTTETGDDPASNPD